MTLRFVAAKASCPSNDVRPPVRADDRTKQRLGQLQNSQRMKPVESGFCELNSGKAFSQPSLFPQRNWWGTIITGTMVEADLLGKAVSKTVFAAMPIKFQDVHHVAASLIHNLGHNASRNVMDLDGVLSAKPLQKRTQMMSINAIHHRSQ